MRFGFVVSLAVAASACGEVANDVPDPESDAGVDTNDPPAPAPSIAEVLDCGTPASAGGLANGQDLQRVDLDLTAFPDARCNDGTGATFYVRPAATAAGSTRWVIQLQGGGACRTPDDCARRWCSVDTNFGMTQMTSSLAPAMGTRGDGILYRGPQEVNPLADANHVFVRYCSSDGYTGHSGVVDVDAAHPVTGAPVRFQIQFQGQAILDAVLATLRRDGAVPPSYMLGGGAIALPDLDDARSVLVAGASAGGGGTVNNLDRIATTLRSHNTTCGVDGCSLQVLGLVDSSYGPAGEDLDWSASLPCTMSGQCTWKDLVTAQLMWEPHGDESCVTWHAASAPATAYLCRDADHVLRNHLTTPFMVRQGQTDQLISGNLIEAGAAVPGTGPMTLASFAGIVRRQLAALAQLRTTAEEGAGIARTPGVFGPPCADHETLSSNSSVYDVEIGTAGTPYTMFDVWTAWTTGGSPQSVIWSPGDPSRCQ